METIALTEDIKIVYVTASSFPAGIPAAMEKLHAIIPFSNDRKYISVSRPENNEVIVYKAGATELNEGELSKHNLQSTILKKGKYYCLEVHNFRKDVMAIANAFQKLIAQKDIDPQGYCVEWYSNTSESVKCMVRIK